VAALAPSRSGRPALLVEYELRRVRCPDCGVRVEAVPWGRPRARHTRDFEDLVAFCAQQMAKEPICRLLRVGWDTVGAIVERVVADHLDADRLAGLLMIGVDELSYRKGQRYLTQVCDHQTGAIVWARPGRDAATLQAFFDELGDRRASIRAISIDMNGGYEKAIREQIAADPGFAPEVCVDPFHVVQLAQRAVDDVRRAEWNAAGKSKSGRGRWVKNVRWSLLKAPERQTVGQLAALHEVSTANRRLYRAFLLKGGAAAALPPRGPLARPGAPHRVAGLGLTFEAQTVRQARPHDPPLPRRHPRRHPPRPLQQPHGGPQQQGPAAQSSLLRLPRARAAHRPHLPVLHRPHHRPAAGMTSTRTTGAPYLSGQLDCDGAGSA
jgi:transposase